MKPRLQTFIVVAALALSQGCALLVPGALDSFGAGNGPRIVSEKQTEGGLLELEVQWRNVSKEDAAAFRHEVDLKYPEYRIFSQDSVPDQQGCITILLAKKKK